MKHIITTLEKGDTPEHSEILERIGPEIVTQVHLANRVEWMPIEINFVTCREITYVIGIRGGEDLFQGIFAGLMESPVFGALLRGIRAMGAKSPAAYIKHGPHVYPLIFRNVGRLKVGAREHKSIVLEYHDMPRDCFAPEMPWIRYSAASFRSAFDYTETQGGFRFLAEEPMNGFARVIFEW